MKHKILRYGLIFLTPLVSLGAFWSVSRAISVSDASVWIVPIIWFSFVFILMGSSIVIIRDRTILLIVSTMSLASSFIFAFDLWCLVVLAVSLVFLGLAQERIKNDLEGGIKVNPKRSIGTGKSMIIFSLALIIASQHRAETKALGLDATVPKVSFDLISSQVAPKTLQALSPEYRNLDGEDLTVDDFILKNQTSISVSGEKINADISQMVEKQAGQNLTEEQKSLIKSQALSMLGGGNISADSVAQTIMLEEGRRKLADLAGRDISGQEKVSDAFVWIVENSINEYFRPKAGEENKLPALALVISLVLFLTIYSLGNLAAWFILHLIQLIFYLFRKAGLILISTEVTEVERLE